MTAAVKVPLEAGAAVNEVIEPIVQAILLIPFLCGGIVQTDIVQQRIVLIGGQVGLLHHGIDQQSQLLRRFDQVRIRLGAVPPA